MNQAYPCLVNISTPSSQYRHFPFLQDQVKIGRAADATYTILSTTISRYHAIIEKQDDSTWTIVDNKSLNGIAVNGQRLNALEPFPLKEGDTVQFGVPISPDVPVEFLYRFCSAFRPPSNKKRASNEDDSSSRKRFKIKGAYPGEGKEPDQTSGVQGKENSPDNTESKEENLKAVYEEQLQALAQQLQDKEQEKQAIARQLQEEREERQMVEEKQKQHEERVNELDSKQKQLEVEKIKAEEQMRRQLEEELQQQEASLRKQMQEQLQSLAGEKKQLEERLQQETEKAVQEKDQELQDRLQVEKDHLQKVIEMKELEQKALESQLAESRVENEKAMADSFSAREAILSQFAETMEAELQCSICNELFVKATSLNCSHVFCSLCIRQWLVVKKECPNCRTPVTSQTCSIVLDNYIDRMVEQLSTDMKLRRSELVAERKKAEEKLDEAEKQAKAGPSGARGRGRVRGGSRGRGRGRRGRGSAATTLPPPTAPSTTATTSAVPAVVATVTVGSSDDDTDGPIFVGSPTDVTAANAIVVSDVESEINVDEDEDGLDEEEQFYNYIFNNDFGDDDIERGSSDSDNSDDEGGGDYVRGYGYYGGYGRCFKCAIHSGGHQDMLL